MLRITVIIMLMIIIIIIVIITLIINEKKYIDVILKYRGEEISVLFWFDIIFYGEKFQCSQRYFALSARKVLI